MVEFISSVTGGPLPYTGRDTEQEFNAAAGRLIAALKKLNVPQDEIDELGVAQKQLRHFLRRRR